MQQITTYAQDAAALVVQVPNEAHRKGDWGAGEVRTHDVKDILSRVTDIAQITWTPSTPAISEIYHSVEDATPFDPNADSRLLEFSVPDTIFDADTNKSDKVNLFAYFRAKAVVKVTLNAQAFVSGRLWLCFNPYANSIDPRRARMLQHLAGITALQGVELDVGSRVEAKLEIPYCSPYESYDIVRDLGSQGVFQLWTLSPLRSGDNQTVTLTVQAWFEDVDVTIPTLADSRFGLTRRLKSAQRLLDRYKFEAQGGEEEVKRKGGLSTVANTVGTVAGALSAVPVIGGIAKPVSVIANIIGKGLSLFGLSKPITDEHTCIYENTPGRGYTHIEGITSSHNMGMLQNNETVPGPNTFATQDDEMKIDEICKNPYMRTQFEWSVDDVPDQLLLKFPVTPGWVAGTLETIPGGGESKAHVFPGPAPFIMSMFGAWRGDMNFRFSRVQTPNHTGRLRVLFVPNVDYPFDPLQHRDDWGHVQSWIIDGNTDTEQNITVEYTGALPFKKASITGFLGTTPDECIGYMYVYVFNELRAPALASQVIDVQVWMNVSNAVFAYPLQRYTVADPIKPSRLPDSPTLCEAQGLEVDVPVAGGDEREQGLEPNPILDMRSDSDKNILVSTYGERVHNLRQFIHRFTLFEVVDDFYTRRYYSDYAPDPAPLSGDMSILNIRDYIGWLYRFRSGGLRYIFAPHIKYPSGRWTASITPIGTNERSPHNVAYDSKALTRGSCIQYTGLNPFLQVQVPYYTNARNRVISMSNTGVYTPALDVHYDVGVAEKSVDVLVSGDDTFSYGWRVGPPRITEIIEIER